MSSLVIDNREKHIINFINDYNSKYNDTNDKKIIKYEIKQLDIGDIQIFVNDKLFILIERKTIKDLISSIIDGRYREQKLRLKSLMNKNIEHDNLNIDNNIKIIYLIEGKLNSNNKSSIPNSTIWSTMTKLIMRDNFLVFRTKSIKESVNFIKTMASKAKESYKQNERIILSNGNNTTSNINDIKNNVIYNDSKNNFYQYSSSIKIKKKENLTPGICFSRQLSQIPGVSARIALVIINEYQSMSKLIIAYESLTLDNDNDNDNIHQNDNPILVRKKKDMLKDIQLTSKRKLGRKLSEKIYDYLYS